MFWVNKKEMQHFQKVLIDIFFKNQISFIKYVFTFSFDDL
jgi:hypothetical protein